MAGVAFAFSTFSGLGPGSAATDPTAILARAARLGVGAIALAASLVRAADAGVTVGLTTRARWFEIASAAEVDLLLGEFRGAPLATFYDSAAAHVRAALGLGAGRPAIELEAAAGALLSDAA